MQKDLESQLWKVRWDEISLPIKPLVEPCKKATSNVDEKDLSLNSVQSNKQTQAFFSSNSPVQILKRTQKQKMKKLPLYKDIASSSEVRIHYRYHRIRGRGIEFATKVQLGIINLRNQQMNKK